MLGFPSPLLFLIFTIGVFSWACELDQMHQGCRIFNAQCNCGYGCMSEYRYENIEECKLSLRGRRSDICYEKPCQNEGSCLQITQEPGYKCRCEGTGYYGSRCDRPCPGPNNIFFRGPFPYECVVI